MFSKSPSRATREREDSPPRNIPIRTQTEVLRDYLRENQSALIELAERDPDALSNLTRTFLCGRVQIEVRIDCDKLIPRLTCEECEVRGAFIYCPLCKEVFCQVCSDRCHRPNKRLNLPHEHTRFLREIREGDTSKAIDPRLKKDFSLPDYPMLETELAKFKDITKPNTLITPKPMYAKPDPNSFLSAPKFKGGDVVVLMSDENEEEFNRFGHVLSEWDFRRGDSAPTITRGPDCAMWYVVRIMTPEEVSKCYYELQHGNEDEGQDGGDAGSVFTSHSSGSNSFNSTLAASSITASEVRMVAANTIAAPSDGLLLKYRRPPDMPTLEGVQEVPFRQELLMSKQIAAKIKEAERLKKFGVTGHFASIFPKHDIDIVEYDHLKNGDDRQYLSPSAARALEAERSLTSSVLIADAQQQQEKQALGAFADDDDSTIVPANQRTYFDVYKRTYVGAIDRSGVWNWGVGNFGNTELDEKRNNYVDMKNMMRILVLPENNLMLPKDYFFQKLQLKEGHMRELITETFKRMIYGKLYDAFNRWADMYYDSIYYEEYNAAARIQAEIRRYLLRNELMNRIWALADFFEHKRQQLHARFKYCENIPGIITFSMDNKKFFATKKGMNDYARQLRIEITKCVAFIDIRRLGMLRDSMTIWKRKVNAAFNESELKGHIMHFTDWEKAAASIHGAHKSADTWSQERLEAMKQMAEYRADVAKMYATFDESFKRGGAAPDVLGRGDDDTYENIFALPLALPPTMQNDPRFIDGETWTEVPTGETIDALQQSVADRSDMFGTEEAMTSATPAVQVPFVHPTMSFATLPHDMTTGMAAGYSASRTGDMIFSNDDHGASHGSNYRDCITVDSSVGIKTSHGMVSRKTRDGVISRMNPLRPSSPSKEEALQDVDGGTVRPKSRVGTSDGILQPVTSWKAPPDLPVIPGMIDPNGNLMITEENKSKYNSFRKRMEGPTEHSCWIIPGVLAMGNLPIGRAWKRRQVKSIVNDRIDTAGQLVMAGLNVFVSLLGEEEEAVGEKRCTDYLYREPSKGGMGLADPDSASQGMKQAARVIPYVPGKAVEMALKDAHSDCKYHYKNLISIYKGDTENLAVDIKVNQTLQHQAPGVDKLKAEEIRLKVRRDYAVENLERARKEFKFAFSPGLDPEFVRFPIPYDSVPSIKEFIPFLWKLEQLIMSGKRLYIYSLEGHGRAGMLCGCLLGRIYGLNPREALFRMQVYHDCTPSEGGRSVPVNCPQLVNQQEMLITVLQNTNRIFDGVTLRSKLNPETYKNEVDHLERGSQLGVCGVGITESAETRLVGTTMFAAGGKASKPWMPIGRTAVYRAHNDALDGSSMGGGSSITSKVKIPHEDDLSTIASHGSGGHSSKFRRGAVSFALSDKSGDSDDEDDSTLDERSLNSDFMQLWQPKLDSLGNLVIPLSQRPGQRALQPTTIVPASADVTSTTASSEADGAAVKVPSNPWTSPSKPLVVRKIRAVPSQFPKLPLIRTRQFAESKET